MATVTPVSLLPAPITDPLLDVSAADRTRLSGTPTLAQLAAVVRQLIGPPSWTWAQWFTQQQTVSMQTQQALNAVAFTNQTASLAAKAVNPAAFAAGLYAVQWFFRVVVADGVGSSLAVTIGFTDKGVACTKTFTAEAGNLVTTCQGGSMNVRSDANAPITIATTYVSGGGGPKMAYDLEAVCQQVVTS